MKVIDDDEFELDFLNSSNLASTVQQENYDRAIDVCLDLLTVIIKSTLSNYDGKLLILFLSKHLL